MAQLEISNSDASIPLQRIATDNNIHPVSFAQARLWFLDRLKTGNAAYNISFAVQMQGKLQVKRLEDCINRVVSRQEILRTSFSRVDGKPVQVIHPHLQVALSVVDVLASEIEEVTTKEHQQCFDLTQVPLLQLKLLRLNSEEHILLLTMHHIIADGMSAEVFMTEVAQYYQGLTLPDLPIQYKDVVYWQNQWLALNSQQHLDYWRAKLKNTPPLLQLPTDKPRPPVQTYQGKCYSWEIPDDLSRQLQSLAQNEGVTLYMLLLAAFKTLLYRYTGQEDLVVGSPIANRNHNKLKGLIGFFVNTLVLRSNLVGNHSFLELLAQIRQVTLEAYAHQDLPFDKLVEVLQPKRDLSYTPLFQVMFAMQNAPQMAKISGLTLNEFKVNSQIAQFDLSVTIENTLEKAIATFEYNTDLFEDVTIARMVGHYQNLLEGIVINPQARLSELPLLSDREKQQLLFDWNPATANISQNLSIHQLFEQQVASTPDAIAVIFEEKQLTYQELDWQAEQLAIYLRHIGIKPNAIVGIYIERSLEVIVAILGILKAGGAYLPLDPVYSQERINLIIKDAKTSLILTHQHLKAKLQQQSAKIIVLDAEWQTIALYAKQYLLEENQNNLDNSSNLDNLAYVIYTSGSTGKPKGVAISHRALVNFAQAAIQEYQITQSDRILQFSTISFDASVEEIYPCLISGGTLVLRTEEMGYSPSVLLQKCQEYSITVLDLPTAFWHLLVTELKKDSTLKSLLSIRLVIIGGEAVDFNKVAIWNQLLEISKSCQLINTYGPTEATVVATSFKIPPQIDSLSTIPIGKPLSNVQTYILDKNLQPVAIGILGELYIGGLSLAQGYLNNPKLTEEKFISNSHINQRLYKTGDKARYLEDGNIEFLGRIDKQVKIRGFRIELTEIEAVINRQQDIKQAIVVAEKTKNDYLGLVAYLLLKDFESNKNNLKRIVRESKNYLKEHLPDYMIPSNWQILIELSLTANGKLNRQGLKTINIESEETFIAVSSNNKCERIIANIWQEILKRENISVRDNFFDIGGHSLLLAQVQEKLEEALNINLSITDLFKYPSINSLANYLNQRENNLLTNKNSDNPQKIASRASKQKTALARQKQLRISRK